MAHKTLVDGTAYEISGGKALIDGTAYNIKNGKTLVGGTVYDIEFVEKASITLTGGSLNLATATIDGIQYTMSQDEVIKVPLGTVIILNVKDSSGYGDLGVLDLVDQEGNIYYTTTSEGDVPYEYTVMGNITIEFDYGTEIDYMSPKHYGILIVYEE